MPERPRGLEAVGAGELAFETYIASMNAM